jgi:putative two-component system response regulator
VIAPPLTPRRRRILVADDAPAVLETLTELLASDGHDVITARDGSEALRTAYRDRPDLILLDVTMPGASGLDLCRHLKADPDVRFTPVVLVSGSGTHADRLHAIEAGADDFLCKPVHARELSARVRALTHVKSLLDELDSAESAFIALALTIEARDPYTNGHCERLAARAVQLGHAWGLGGADLSALHRGGYLHDVGKIGVPDAVLLKPGPLTADELTIMRRHPDIGDALCEPLRSLRSVRPIVRAHHERLDGSGYPRGLRGDDVPLLAQIVAVVDVHDALTSKRPYRDALPFETARHYLLDEVRRGRFSPQLVTAFFDVLTQSNATQAVA